MAVLTIQDAKAILAKYPLKGKIKSFVPYGEGHINFTFLLTLTNQAQETGYILQVINNHVFPSVSHLMSNYVKVSEYCQQQIKKEKGNPDRETINVIFTKNHQSYLKYQNKYIRILKYIDHTITLQIVKNPSDFYHGAIAFANFYRFLNRFNANQLYEIIPNFHNTQKRYNDFLKAVRQDNKKRKRTCKKEINFINARKHYYDIIIKMLKKKELPLRVTHNDTKLNNVLFDQKTHLPVAVIDLDTIMPGSLCYDFGDAIRSGCNSASEDEKNLNKVHFRFDLYKLFLKGFVETLGKNITKKEKETLAISSIIMTIECGMRFLTDYLNGDKYFHIKYSNHNLIRCRTQLKLVSEMEKNLAKMKSLVK
ncbi:MAG: aminoglycoside phosphotransferase family protein [Bacilli bacterium]|nr:aminoglycoside phosphotransferase family protein [Bacilli bacterium]